VKSKLFYLKVNHFETKFVRMIKLIQTKQIFGGAMRDRTADLFAASEALSQLSYSPAYK
jgi:hypothetical protein